MDGHVKWLQPEQVSWGYRATNPTTDEFSSGGTGTVFAQGTQYAGANKKQITFSYR